MSGQSSSPTPTSELNSILLTQIQSLNKQIASLKSAHKGEVQFLLETVAFHEQNHLAVLQREANNKRIHESIIDSYKIAEQLISKKLKDMEYLQQHVHGLAGQNNEKDIRIAELEQKVLTLEAQNRELKHEVSARKNKPVETKQIEDEIEPSPLTIQQLETYQDSQDDEEDSDQGQQQNIHLTSQSLGPGSIVNLESYLRFQSTQSTLPKNTR